CAPGVPGCPLCWDLSAAGGDPLRTRRTQALLSVWAGQEDIPDALAAGALAVRQALQWIDQGAAPEGAVLHLRAGSGVVDALTVAPHRDCACAGWSDGTAAPAGEATR
ncbi:MAG TPA: hypothetical protein VIG75_06950, partial [Citricoccus sp.]